MLFSVFFVSFLIHCLYGDDSLNYNGVDCEHKSDSKCFIEATFGNIATNETVEVFVSCSNDNEIAYNQFLKIDKIIWSGCQTPRNLNAFGLKKISWKKQVRNLKIEKFSVDYLGPGTFDGFSRLEVLSIQHNSIQYLLKSCFRGLENLKFLQMIEHELKWIDDGLLSDLPKLSDLDIRQSQNLLIANHQFTENQIVDNVKLEIYSVAMDLLEHLFLHVRNLSIIIKLKYDTYDCVQTRLNGYERNWIIEGLKLSNLLCGFIMENVPSIKELELELAFILPYPVVLELKELPHLENFTLRRNSLQNLSSCKFVGDFKSLKLLDLSGNGILEIDMRAIETFPNLKTINLKNNFIKKLGNMNTNKFENVQFLVDRNDFDCSWLSSIATSKVFSNFIYEKDYQMVNVAGLSCSLNLQFDEITFPDEEFIRTSYLTETENNSKQEKPVLSQLLIIACINFLIGMTVMYMSIYLYQKRQSLYQEPFYHMLRDSLVRPIHNASSTMRRDFKEIVSRILPPTNYEHPISDSPLQTEMTDVATNTSNIYEEIPPKPYQEIV